MDSGRLGAMLLAGVLAAGCESMPEKAAPQDPQAVTPGSVLEVTEGFPITVRSAGVYFQRGVIVPGAEIRHGYPYCRFQIEQIPSGVETIVPQVFSVGDVRLDESTTRSGRRTIAYTVLDLEGGLQGHEGASLHCRWPWVVGDARYTTPADIQDAVQGYMKLTLAP
jgi:hypothetical protein